MTKTSKLLLFILLGTLCAQSFSLRVASTSQSLSMSELDSSLDSTLESSSFTSAVTLSSAATTWFPCFSPTQDNSWSYNAGFSKFTCAGNTYVGPYSKGAKITSPTFTLGPHKGIIVSFKVAFLDSWDGESLIVTADGHQVYAKLHNGAWSPSNTCGQKWGDAYETITFGFNHAASTLTLVITSNLNGGTNDESWGICNLAVSTSPYLVNSDGTPLTMTPTASTTTFFSCSAPVNEFGWLYFPAYSTISCGGRTFLGPFAAGGRLYSPYILLNEFPHQGITVSFEMAWIDSWDSETFTVLANNVPVYSKLYNGAWSQSHWCNKKWADGHEIITFGFNHTDNYLVLDFITNLNGGTDDESWGICNLQVTISQYPVASSGSAITTPGSSSSSPSSKGYYILSSVFPNELNLGCLNINNVASYLTRAVTYLSNAGDVTKSIIDSTVNTIVTALLNNPLTGDVASTNACLGNFDGSYITNEIEECSAMLLPDESRYSVISFNIPIPGEICSAKPDITMASFCAALGHYKGLPSLSIQANAGTLSCITTAAGSGVGYVIGTALEAGLEAVSVGESLTSSYVKTASIFTGKIENVQISGNYYDYQELGIDAERFSLPEVFEISGSATRVLKVVDNAATWVNKLSNAKGVKDVALDLFGDLSMLVALEVEMTLALAQQTLGWLPDLGPYRLGLGTLFASTYPTTLESGQTLKRGVYTYITANDVLPTVNAEIMDTVMNKASGIFNTILKEFDLSVSSITKNAMPGGLPINQFGYMVNTEEIGLLVQIPVSAIPPLILTNSRATIQCTFKYNNAKISCNLKIGSISKFFTGFISGAAWVIKEAKEFFDETGKAIAFVDKQLGAFTDEAVATTAKNIKNGVTVVAGYTTEAAAWAAAAVACPSKIVTDAEKCGTTSIQCGTEYITDAIKCGEKTVTDAVICNTEWVTSGTRCGTKIVTDAAKCGMKTITDGAICGFKTGWNCVSSLFTKCKAKSCDVAASCPIDLSCEVPKTCNVTLSCDWPKYCPVANTCAIDNC